MTARALLPLLYAPLLSAQAPDLETLSARWNRVDLLAHLASPEPIAVAWAAHRVAQQHDRGAIPAVRAALGRVAGANDIEHQVAGLLLLDVLLQFDVRVPGEELAPCAIGAMSAPCLILAARSPLQNTGFLAATHARHRRDLEWIACGNLLAAQRAPRFLASCLQNFTPTWQIEVFDDGPPRARAVGVG